MSSISSFNSLPFLVAEAWPASASAPASPPLRWVFFCSCSGNERSLGRRSEVERGPYSMAWPRPTRSALQSADQRGGVLGGLQKPLHVLPRSPQGFAGGHPLKALPPG